MKIVRLSLVALSVLAVCCASAATAKAPAFAPKPGAYAGTSKSGGKTVPVTGAVIKRGSGYLAQLLLPATMKCADDTELAVGMPIYATLKGKTFSVTERVEDNSTGGTATVKVSGKFTSAKAFSGTGSKDLSAGSVQPQLGACSTGPISFSLKLK